MTPSDAQRIERLEKLRRNFRGNQWHPIEECFIELYEEIARLRVDAQRYQWLRNSDADWEPYIAIDDPRAGQGEGPSILTGSAADTAIDAALAATAPMRAEKEDGRG